MALVVEAVRADVDIFAIGDRLEFNADYRLNLAREPEMLIALDAGDQTFLITARNMRQLGMGCKHNWIADIECDEMEALREALTYRVVCYPPDHKYGM